LAGWWLKGYCGSLGARLWRGWIRRWVRVRMSVVECSVCVVCRVGGLVGPCVSVRADGCGRIWLPWLVEAPQVRGRVCCVLASWR